jgi:hypothetical protein
MLFVSFAAHTLPHKQYNSLSLRHYDITLQEDLWCW